MISTIPIVVIRGVHDVQVDGRVRARDERGTRGVEDVSEDCARRRATRWALRQAGPSGDCVGSWPPHQLPRSTSRPWSYRRILDRSRCRRAATYLRSSHHLSSHSSDRQRRPGCCAAGSPLRHGYDAGTLSGGAEQYRKRCGFAPEKSSKASSDLWGKHATFVASLTALAADTRHSITMERSWVMACPSRGNGVFCRRDAALARPWAHRLLPPLGCFQASRAPRTQATTRRMITSHRHAA